METEAVNSFYYFTKYLKIPVTKHFVKDFLLSHPAYPSMAAYADLCDKLNMEYTALELTIEQLMSKNQPAIAHIFEGKKTFFIIIKSIEKAMNQITYYHPNKGTISETIENFLSKWTKYVFYALPNNNSGEDNYFKKRTLEILSFLAMPLLICSILILFFFFIWQSNETSSIRYIFFLLLKIIGLFICLNLVSHNLGNSTKLSKMVCVQGKYTNCDDVLNSPASKLFGMISMTDIGLVYFSGSIIAMILSIYFNIQNIIISFFLFISSFSLPYILFSIYYQSIRMKQWCPFCLSVILILLIECISFFFNLKYFHFREIINITTFFVILFSFTFMICFWSIIKSLLIQSQDAKYKYDFLRLKKNPHIFNARFKELNSIVMDYSDKDIIIGDPNTKLTITTLLNTRCAPCAQVHKKMKKLLADYSDHLKLVIRFTTGRQNEEETLHLIEVYKTYGPMIFNQALSDWFENKNCSVLREKYIVSKISSFSIDLLMRNLQWFEKSHFTSTPTIILENKKIENEYDIDDVQWLVQNLIYESSHKSLL